MQLPEPLLRRWLAVTRIASRTLAIDEQGITLGRTLLAPFVNGRLVIEEEHLAAMLSVAYGREIPAAIVKSFRNAERRFKSGDKALANMHLALTGLHAVDVAEAQRLFVAEWAMDNGVTPVQLRKLCLKL